MHYAWSAFDPTGSPEPTSTSSPDGRSQSFRAVEGGTQMQSGEALLVEAYVAIWIVLFAFLMLSWRRQKKIDQRIATLEIALDKARRDARAGQG